MARRSTVGNKARIKAMGLDQGPGRVNEGQEDQPTGFADLDDVMASKSSIWKRPWWIKEVDVPTMDIDWQATERFDQTQIQQMAWRKYVGDAKADKLEKRRGEKFKQWMLENRDGYTLRDRALDMATRNSGHAPVTFQGSWLKKQKAHADETPEDRKKRVDHDLSLNLPPVLSPEEMGVPRWEGTPQENARMIRAAARLFGADQVGYVELNENTKKLIFKRDAMDGKRIEFENVEHPYETKDKRVIPDKARSVITFSVKMSEELIKRKNDGMPTGLSSAATGIAYGQAKNILDRLQNFLRALGYIGLNGSWYNGLGIAPAFGVLAGLGEMGRINRMISPEYGPLQRVFKLVTDLPLEPTKPIDAGIMNFCRTCKVCADNCPSDCLSKKTDPYWEPRGPWNSPGHKTWYEDSPACWTWWNSSAAGCSTCFAVCTFAKKNKSIIHDIVKLAIAKNKIMPDQVNGFFTKMDQVFGYQEQKDIEQWWEMDLPPRGASNAKGNLLD
ncbi:reductive dehalogenase [Pseudomonadota bacterium]